MLKYLPIILVVAVLGIMMVLAGCNNNKQATSATAGQPTAAATTSAANAAPAKITIAPDEASCPVMGTVMKKSAMIPLQYQGKTYYMCCQDCVAKFKADPTKYINHPATPTREMGTP